MLLIYMPMVHTFPRLTLSVVLCCGLIAALRPANAAEAQKPAKKPATPAALDLVEKRYAALKAFSQTVSGKLNLSARGDTATATIDAKVLIARPNRFKLDMTMNFFGEDRHVVIVSNGSKLVEYDPDDHEYAEQPLATLAANAEKLSYWFSSRTFDISIPLFLTAGHKSGNDRVEYSTAGGAIDGHPVTIVSINGPAKSGPSAPMKLYIDSKARLVRRFSLSMPLPTKQTGGVPVTLSLVSDYTGVETELDIPGDTFEFTPPDDAKRVAAVRPINQRAFDTSK